MKATRFASSALCGVLFALGLGLAGMTDANVVLGFLDLSGTWDPSLAFVMGGALAVYIPAHQWFARRGRQPNAPAGTLPPPGGAIDRPLLVGAALFGVGWGMGGFCPGPGLVSVASGAPAALVFVASMLGGMALHRWLRRGAAPQRTPCDVADG